MELVWFLLYPILEVVGTSVITQVMLKRLLVNFMGIAQNIIRLLRALRSKFEDGGTNAVSVVPKVMLISNKASETSLYLDRTRLTQWITRALF